VISNFLGIITRDLETGPSCLLPLISKKRGCLKTIGIYEQERYQKKKTSVKGEDSEECNHEYRDNQESNVGYILITKLNAEVLGF
jgi:hypothetical protein